MKFGGRPLTNPDDVFEHNNWCVVFSVNQSDHFQINHRDNVEWDEEQREDADKKVAENSAVLVDAEKVREYEQKAGEYWDQFYDTHQRSFFKDRHWLFTEFTELISKKSNESPFVIFEVGCGVGNTIFPILQMNLNSKMFVYGCDFSAVAIDLLKQQETYDESRCHAFVLDATTSEWNVPFEKSSVDFILLIYTLSAIDPSKFNSVIQNAFKYLKPGGLLLFRDYGRHDMAQLRFKKGNCLGANFYVRGDGTRAYFFSEEEVDGLFTGQGFLKQELHVDRRLQVNRGKKIRMFRVWIQAKYKKPH